MYVLCTLTHYYYYPIYWLGSLTCIMLFETEFTVISLNCGVPHDRCWQKKLWYTVQKVILCSLCCCGTVLPVKGIWQSDWVWQWTLLLTGKLLFHSEHVIINNYWHHCRQKTGHNFQILQAHSISLQSIYLDWFFYIMAKKIWIMYKQNLWDYKRCFLKTEVTCCTYQTGLFKDLAVNHVPRPLTQWQHPQQQHQVWTILINNRK